MIVAASKALPECRIVGASESKFCPLSGFGGGVFTAFKLCLRGEDGGVGDFSRLGPSWSLKLAIDSHPTLRAENTHKPRNDPGGALDPNAQLYLPLKPSQV